MAMWNQSSVGALGHLRRRECAVAWAVFRTNLVDLKDKFGIAAIEVTAPYTSQEYGILPLR
jgi:hypothetical protein